MPVEVFLLVLGSALMHAAWNALVKADGDRLALIKVLSATQLVLSLCLLPFVAAPAAESWPYLAASSILGTAYMLSLNQAYHAGDLSFVYPLARGIAPLLVAIVSVVLLGDPLSRTSRIAILLIGLGIISLALTRGAAGIRDPRPVLLALGTGGLIAAYTIIDGLGARASGSAHGYVVWVFLVMALLTIAGVHVLQRGPRVAVGRRSWRMGVVAGVMSYATGWVVIWAFTLAPIALVSALRETGTVFAVLIGVVVLKERLSLARLASIAAALVGTTLLKVSR